MRFAPLVEKLTMVCNEAQLRSCFMDYAGELVGATAWGLDLLDSRLRVLESDLSGVPDTFRDRYQKVGQSGDPVSQRMIQQQIPVHHLSVQSLNAWHQSELYQDVFHIYRLATLRFAIAPSLIKSLTSREVEVVELVAQGFSNREIALKLHK